MIFSRSMMRAVSITSIALALCRVGSSWPIDAWDNTNLPVIDLGYVRVTALTIFEAYVTGTAPSDLLQYNQRFLHVFKYSLCSTSNRRPEVSSPSTSQTESGECTNGIGNTDLPAGGSRLASQSIRPNWKVLQWPAIHTRSMGGVHCQLIC